MDKLKETDRQVRAHEQAHMAAGGNLVQGGASYTYQKGPDGRMYAVGGEVSIDTSPGSTPEETLAKARQIRAAALAPSDPSPQDRRVAAGAARLEASARAEQAKQGGEGQMGPDSAEGAVQEPDSARVSEGDGRSVPSLKDVGRGESAGVFAAYRLETRGSVAASRIDLFA